MKRVHDFETSRKRSGQRGVTAVEVAIVAPILMVLFVGIMNVGLLIWEHQVIQNAAREGARFSALPVNSMAISANPATTLSSIQQYVVNYAANENVTISPANVTVNQQYPITVGGMTPYGSRVIVSYPRSVLVPGGLLGFNQVSLYASSVFRNLY